MLCTADSEYIGLKVAWQIVLRSFGYKLSH